MNSQDNYLTESSLGLFLREYLPNGTWVFNKCFPNNRFRPDYRNDFYKITIEFDGYQHYTSSSVIYKDSLKDKIYQDSGYKCIRIPYFIQLSDTVIKELFSINCNYIQTFPHGFIADKSTMILPADFCELGVKRFKEDLEKFSFIKKDIIISLKNQLTKKEKCEILPPSLYYLID